MDQRCMIKFLPTTRTLTITPPRWFLPVLTRNWPPDFYHLAPENVMNSDQKSESVAQRSSGRYVVASIVRGRGTVSSMTSSQRNLNLPCIPCVSSWPRTNCYGAWYLPLSFLWVIAFKRRYCWCSLHRRWTGTHLHNPLWWLCAPESCVLSNFIQL
jgi:hypothetical protein